MRGPRAPRPSGLVLSPWQLSVVAMLLLLLALPMVSAQSGGRRRVRPMGQCESLPRFEVNGVDPMAVTRGRVTVVALMIHTCSFCQGQAYNLSALNTELGDEVSVFIVNGGGAGRGSYEGARGLPVYQDDDSNTMWRQVFRGGKDDIFVFNRCGKLTYRIPFPYSYLGYSYVRRAIDRSLNSRMCEPNNCQPRAQPGPRPRPGYNPYDVMQGDAPWTADNDAPAYRRGRRFGRNRGSYHGNRHASTVRVSRNRNRSRSENRSACPLTDELCRELRRARRRWSRFRKQDGLGPVANERVLGLFGQTMAHSLSAGRGLRGRPGLRGTHTSLGAL